MSNRPYLQHMLKEINFLLDYAEELSKDAFLADERAQKAFERSLEIMGEASKKIDPVFRKTHSEIEWRKMSDTRNVIIHDYFDVDYDVVWDIVVTKLPDLRMKITALMARLPNG